MSGHLVREALPGDLETVQQLYLHLRNAARNQPVGQVRADQFVSQLQRYPGSALLVGLTEDRVVSTCTLVVIPNLTNDGRPYALLENVVTHPDARKRGIATAVLRDAARSAFAAGCYKVMLMTGSKNPNTLTFYEKAGFEQSKTGFQMRAAT